MKAKAKELPGDAAGRWPGALALALLVVAAAAGDAGARSELPPPTKVHVVKGRLRSLETIEIGRPLQIVRIDLIGGSAAGLGGSAAGLGRVELVPYDPGTSCTRAYVLHDGDDLVAHAGALVGPFAITAGTCAQEDSLLARPPSTWTPVRGAPSLRIGGREVRHLRGSWKRLVERRDDRALPGLRRILEVFGHDLDAPFQREVCDALGRIQTTAALRLGAEHDLSVVWMESLRWTRLPGAFEVLEPIASADLTAAPPIHGRSRLLEVMWQVSPTRTLALIERLLPAHARGVLARTRDLDDPRLYDVLIAHHDAATSPEIRRAIVEALTDRSSKAPADEYLEAFYRSIGPAGAPRLAMMEERRRLGLTTPAGLAKWARSTRWAVGAYRAAEGMRISIAAAPLLGGDARDAVNGIRVRYTPDGELPDPPVGTAVIVSGVIRRVRTSPSTGTVDLEIAHPAIERQAAPAPEPAAPEPAAPEEVATPEQAPASGSGGCCDGGAPWSGAAAGVVLLGLLLFAAGSPARRSAVPRS